MENNVDSIEARYVLGLILSDQLPNVAADLIALGEHSRSLVELASSSVNSGQELRQLFQRAMVELGRGMISKESALKRFTKDVSAQILAKTVSPYDGAKLIWKTYRDASVDETHDYDAFIYAASEFEDRPRDRKHFEKAIVEEAQRWTNNLEGDSPTAVQVI